MIFYPLNPSRKFSENFFSKVKNKLFQLYQILRGSVSDICRYYLRIACLADARSLEAIALRGCFMLIALWAKWAQCESSLATGCATWLRRRRRGKYIGFILKPLTDQLTRSPRNAPHFLPQTNDAQMSSSSKLDYGGQEPTLRTHFSPLYISTSKKT